MRRSFLLTYGEHSNHIHPFQLKSQILWLFFTYTVINHMRNLYLWIALILIFIYYLVYDHIPVFSHFLLAYFSIFLLSLSLCNCWYFYLRQISSSSILLYIKIEDFNILFLLKIVLSFYILFSFLIKFSIEIISSSCKIKSHFGIFGFSAKLSIKNLIYFWF